MATSHEEKLLIQFARDLSTLTADEIRERWGEAERAALAACGEDFEDRLRNHNPIFYLAQRVFFVGALDLLYAPLHRDRVCGAILDYILSPTQDDSGLLFLIQRDSFKSTFAHRVVPTWFALREKHLHGKDATILLRHHKEEMASDNVVVLKNAIMASTFMKQVWPEFWFGEDIGTKTWFDWPCKKKGALSEPSILAAGLTTNVTGRHFHLRLNDDLVTKEHRESKVVRDNAFREYMSNKYTRVTGRSWEINTGTPYHPNDLWSKLLKANVDGRPLYKSVVIGASDADISEASLSFPTRHTVAELKKMRQEEYSSTGNTDLFNLQMLCQYRDSRIVAAQWEWIQHCKQEEVPTSAWRLVTIDPAWKGTKNSGEGDFASIQVWALERRGHLVLRYLLDGYHSNELTDAEGIELIFRASRKYGAITLAPEEQGGHSFRERLKREAASRGVFVDVIEDLKYTNVGKPQRITAFLGECQMGRTFVCDECDYDLAEHFKEEFKEYPQVDHDDALDAAAITCDPEVANRAFPLFNSNASTHPMLRKREAPIQYRTRYCAT